MRTTITGPIRNGNYHISYVAEPWDLGPMNEAPPDAFTPICGSTGRQRGTAFSAQEAEPLLVTWQKFVSDDAGPAKPYECEKCAWSKKTMDLIRDERHAQTG